MATQKIKVGDEVIALAGKDKGRTGNVKKLIKDKNRKVIKVLVEGINMMKKHVRPNPELGEKGGVVSMEAALDVSNVAVYNPVAKKGDRIGIKTLEDGKKVRYFKSNGEIVDI
ncbi:MAG: 50S ribosomal protein L24 [Legionellales bacterium]|nr:50S ribosomal protein L24 [Legionellales bacterium]|tara:strand:+ start:876 stop:1214 length:339 start_codon:yes stop_codon:yes gene_type:complete